jgi:hypothetical protein
VQREPANKIAIFGHLSNIAQRQRARKEIVIAWDSSGWKPQAKSEFKKSTLDLQQF